MNAENIQDKEIKEAKEYENKEEVITIEKSLYVDIGKKIFDDIQKYEHMRVLYYLEQLKEENGETLK